MQRSAPPSAPLLIPVEGPISRRCRKARLAALDALLLAVEDFNARWKPETPVYPSWLLRAERLGVHIRWPMTGAKLHAAILDRQEALMLPVYMRRFGRLHLVGEKGLLAPVVALRDCDVREIA